MHAMTEILCGGSTIEEIRIAAMHVARAQIELERIQKEDQVIKTEIDKRVRSKDTRSGWRHQTCPTLKRFRTSTFPCSKGKVTKAYLVVASRRRSSRK